MKMDRECKKFVLIHEQFFATKLCLVLAVEVHAVADTGITGHYL